MPFNGAAKKPLSFMALIENTDIKTQECIQVYKSQNIQSSLNLKNSYKAVQEYKTTHNATSHS